MPLCFYFLISEHPQVHFAAFDSDPNISYLFLSFPSLMFSLRAPSKVLSVFAQFVLVYSFRFSFMEWQVSSSEKVFVNQLDLDPHEGRKPFHLKESHLVHFLYFIHSTIIFFAKIVQYVFLCNFFYPPFSF